MTARWSIRKKLLVAVVILAIVVAVLGGSSFRAAYAYRDLAVTLSQRATELPDTTRLTRAVDELKYVLRPAYNDVKALDLIDGANSWSDDRIRNHLRNVDEILSSYHRRLTSDASNGQLLSDTTAEQLLTEDLKRLLRSIRARYDREEIFPSVEASELQFADLRDLSEKAHRLPTFLQDRMARFRDEVRTQYRLLIGLTWASSALVAILLIGLCVYFRSAVVRPFKTLLQGSRRVAAGEFGHRIEIASQDELSELANAINTGTESFLQIQRDLNNQVRERSCEVIRNEQLASVGFLAAGVAHEINNPLASIAWSAEALESRLHRILNPSKDAPDEDMPPQDLDVLRTYLRRIQDEAFRCKGITERLLDFSRLGQAQRKQKTDMTALVQDVIDMVLHLGQYRSRKIEFNASPGLIAWASPQEIKQVVLNLLTNALDALAENQPDGRVNVSLQANADQLRLTIEDNGCGMSDEVQKHLFEPFFTRRRDGRGTGLGLPITSRIIADHGGRITPHSEGIGCGSKFDVLLPTVQPTELNERQYQAA